MSFPATMPPPSSITSALQHDLPPSAATSPAEQWAQYYLSDLQHASQRPCNPLLHPRSPVLSAPASKASPPSPHPPTQADSLPHPPFSEPQPPYSTPQHSPKLPALHSLKTRRFPSMSAARTDIPNPLYPPPSTTCESSAPQSAVSMNQHYPYSQCLPRCPLSAPSASTLNLAYPSTTLTYTAPPRYPPQSWRGNSEIACLEEKEFGRSSPAPYDDSVKRHLESFNLKASLTEMADGSGWITEFSKIYRQWAHETQRTGMTLQSMPRLEEVNDMLKQSERISISLQRMRNVVFSRHEVSIVEPPQYPRYRPSNDDNGSNYGDDTKGMDSFDGGDNKTRNQDRAVPPESCHSCNRADTPEWRRGPDGARTLCNACGLRYAKLTRKMCGKQAMTSLNLRPKSIGHVDRRGDYS